MLGKQISLTMLVQLYRRFDWRSTRFALTLLMNQTACLVFCACFLVFSVLHIAISIESRFNSQRNAFFCALLLCFIIFSSSLFYLIFNKIKHFYKILVWLSVGHFSSRLMRACVLVLVVRLAYSSPAVSHLCAPALSVLSVTVISLQKGFCAFCSALAIFQNWLLICQHSYYRSYCVCVCHRGSQTNDWCRLAKVMHSSFPLAIRPRVQVN